MKTKTKILLAAAVCLTTVAVLWAQGTVSLNNKLSSNEPKVPRFVSVTLSTGTAVAGSATDLLFTSAMFYGVKTVVSNAAPTANTATAYIGYLDNDGAVVTVGTAAIIDTIPAGGSLLMRAVPGEKYNLKDFYFLGTTGDKVIVQLSQ